MSTEKKSFSTLCIHGGINPESTTGAIMTPIYQTSTYVQDSPGNHKGYEYSRASNPTRSVLEHNLAAIENASYGLAFSSGCAAASAIFTMLSPGSHVLCVDDLYGGTYRLLTKVFTNFGIESSYEDLTDPEKISALIRSNTRLIWIETPTNPLLKLIDIERICSIAKKNNILVVVDNTLATPYIQQPLNLGADLVVHSTTKYLGGHSDVIGGAIVTNNKELHDKLHFILKSTGGVPSPFDCFLVLRGIKTLHVRMKQHIKNASELALFLTENDIVQHVYYPGLTHHPQFTLSAKQMKGPGGMLSFVVKGGEKAAKSICSTTKIFACAESLGGVESLIEHPASMTHASIPEDIRNSIGVVGGLIRISVGIEDLGDLKQDLAEALHFVRKNT